MCYGGKQDLGPWDYYGRLRLTSFDCMKERHPEGLARHSLPAKLSSNGRNEKCRKSRAGKASGHQHKSAYLSKGIDCP